MSFNIEVQYKFNYQGTKLKEEYYCNANENDPNCQYEKMNNNGIVNTNNFKFTKVEHIIEPRIWFI